MHDPMGAWPLPSDPARTMAACPVNVLSAPQAPGRHPNTWKGTTTMTPPNEVVRAGIDTHTDTHTIALLDERGRPPGTETFTADPEGYDRLIGMPPGPGRVAAVGVEGTNSFGAALARRLTAAGYEVREAPRPRRSVRRRDGRSDSLDAVAAARSIMAGDGTSLPKSPDGWVEALRHLNAQRSQPVSAMTAIPDSTNGLLAAAPESVRERYRGVEGRDPHEQARRMQTGRRPGRA